MLLLSSGNIIEQTMIEQEHDDAMQRIVLSPKDIQRVYDGDTFFVNLPNQVDVLGRNIGIRIRGIDTPERRSNCRTSDQRSHEKALATKATVLLRSQLISANTIVLTNLGRDKYFRVLATVHADGINVTHALMKEGLAVLYDGGAKRTWCK